MNEAILVPIAIVFIVIGLPVMSITLLKLAKIMKGDQGSAKNSSLNDRDEAALMQSIHSSLGRLEKRIDALETIVLETEKTKK